MKVGTVELYINHWLPGEELEHSGSVSVEHKQSLKGAAGFCCHGDVLHQQSQKRDRGTTDWETAAVKARKDVK